MNMKAKFRVTIITCMLFSFFMWCFAEATYGESFEWKESFDEIQGESQVPKEWKLKGKPGTPKATFFVTKEGYLHLEANNESASLVNWVKNLDLEKASILRWKWRVTVTPKGADGRFKAKDDQAIGIYIGTGNMLSSKSISYRWDTETPRGAEGSCVYGGGAIKVKWLTLRNKEDINGEKWYTEERNWLKDFKDAWGFYPKKVYISVSCNSQYTGTEAEADLDWIGFTNLLLGEESPGGAND